MGDSTIHSIWGTFLNPIKKIVPFSYLQFDGYFRKNKLSLISWHFFCCTPRLIKGHIYMGQREGRKWNRLPRIPWLCINPAWMMMASLLHSATHNSSFPLWSLKLNYWRFLGLFWPSFGCFSLPLFHYGSIFSKTWKWKNIKPYAQTGMQESSHLFKKSFLFLFMLVEVIIC